MTSEDEPQLGEDQLLVLYDGSCAFCLGWVRRLAALDRHDRLRFLALQSPRGERLAERHPFLDVRNPDTMVAVRHLESPREDLRIKSGAVLQIGRSLGWPYKIGLVFGLLPRSWRDGIYDLIARHRHRFAGDETCVLQDEGLKRRLWT